MLRYDPIGLEMKKSQRHAIAVNGLHLDAGPG
jgi:hypothetical protein